MFIFFSDIFFNYILHYYRGEILIQFFGWFYKYTMNFGKSFNFKIKTIINLIFLKPINQKKLNVIWINELNKYKLQ